MYCSYIRCCSFRINVTTNLLSISVCSITSYFETFRHADGGDDVMFIITKSSNQNTVVYKAVGGAEGVGGQGAAVILVSAEAVTRGQVLAA